jgi:hypothetical protein
MPRLAHAVALQKVPLSGATGHTGGVGGQRWLVWLLQLAWAGAGVWDSTCCRGQTLSVVAMAARVGHHQLAC